MHDAFRQAVTDADLGSPYENNGALIAEFYLDAVENTDKSAEAGRPIYEEREHLELRIAGNMREIRRRQMRESDKKRFPREYAAFRQGLAAPEIGTPLDRLPFLNRSQVAEFRAVGIKTAEQFRDMSDADGAKFMGYAQLKRRVADFLAAAEGHAPLSEMRSQLDQGEAERAAMAKQIADLAARLEAAESKGNP